MTSSFPFNFGYVIIVQEKVSSKLNGCKKLGNYSQPRHYLRLRPYIGILKFNSIILKFLCKISFLMTFK